MMKQYETEVVVKNGVSVNTVYIVKPGDTIAGIRKTVKRLGGEPKDLEKIDPGFRKGLAPGKFVYFNSNLPRLPELEQKIINTHELERCSYQVLTVTKNDFKAKIDDVVGYNNAWIEVMQSNRFTVEDFEAKPATELKIYHAKNVFGLNNAKGQPQKNMIDQQLAQNIEVVTEKVLVNADRAPASAEENHGPGGLVWGFLVVLIIALVLAYQASKKRVALNTSDQ